MAIAGNGRALLIAPRFFGYENDIRDQLATNGWTVDMLPDRPFDSSALKAVTRVRPLLLAPAADRYYLAELRRLAPARYHLILVIQGESVFEPTLRMLRSEFPAARMIFYTWDSISNKPYSKKQLPLYDECFSFDPMDATRYGVRFRPLFFTRGVERGPSARFEFDISFVGTIHSDRYRIVRRIAQDVPDPTRAYWYLYLQAPWMYAARRIFTNTIAGAARAEFRFEPLPRATVRRIFLESRAALDIEHPQQRGLTMRTIEALGSQTKLVTTNAGVRDVDFFDPDNISIIDRENPRIPPGFLTTPYRPVPEAIRDRYRLEAWVRDVCGG